MYIENINASPLTVPLFLISSFIGTLGRLVFVFAVFPESFYLYTKMTLFQKLITGQDNKQEVSKLSPLLANLPFVSRPFNERPISSVLPPSSFYYPLCLL